MSVQKGFFQDYLDRGHKFLEYLMVDQVQIFLYSLVLGLILGIIYDIFRIFRLTFNVKKWGIFFQDILYFITISLVSFSFIIIFNKGEVRYYIIIGQLIGGVIYYISLGRIVYKYSKNLLWHINRFFRNLFFPLKVIFNKSDEIKLYKDYIKK